MSSRPNGNRYIGRGSTDDKGPALTALFGARYAIERLGTGLRREALHKKSWAVIDRPYSLGCATVRRSYERPRCIFCAKPRRDVDVCTIFRNLSSLAAERTAPLVSQSSFANTLPMVLRNHHRPSGWGNFYREPVEFRLCSGRGQAITA